jgi:hypothetical protein
LKQPLGPKKIDISFAGIFTFFEISRIIMRDNMIKKAILFLAASFFLLIIPSGGDAQTISANREGGGEVAIMPFVALGNLPNTAQLYGEVIAEVDNLGIYYARRVSADDYPEIITLSADMPPDTKYLEASPYALTGEFYMDTEDFQHLQIWLWDFYGHLLYTDEMVSESYEESLDYIPILIRWVFSNVFRDAVTSVRDRPVSPVAAVRNDTVNLGNTLPEPLRTVRQESSVLERFYLGLRGGVSFNNYSVPQVVWDYESGQSRSVGYEAALLAEFRPLRFLSLQAEVIFTQDVFNAARTAQGGGTVDRADAFRATSLSFPLLIKLPIEFEIFDLSLYGGAYLILPLGDMNVKIDGSVDTVSVYKVTPPVGFSVGVDLGFLLGPGRLLLDLRYSKNIGVTKVQRNGGLQYTKDMIGLTLGYKFILWK